MLSSGRPRRGLASSVSASHQIMVASAVVPALRTLIQAGLAATCRSFTGVLEHCLRSDEVATARGTGLPASDRGADTRRVPGHLAGRE
jgi:hypothetical protein